MSTRHVFLVKGFRILDSFFFINLTSGFRPKVNYYIVVAVISTAIVWHN